jgi:polysaccharide export outer membrane protein
MRFSVALRVGLLFAICCSCIGGAQVQKREAGDARHSESLFVGRGDLLQISIFREPDLEQKVRVKDSGDVDLNLVGAVNVAGKTPDDAAKAIEQAYIRGNYLNQPQVSVLIVEYATQGVSVLGQVAKPGTVPLTTPRSLLDVLSLVGGLTELADRHVTIQRGDKSGNIAVFLPNNADASVRASIVVYPGDTVIVPKAGLVYVLGDVARPGGYVMQDDAKLTVLQAMAMAAGTNKTAKESGTRLIRRVNGNYEEQAVPLRDIELGRKPDMQLEADDVLYVPFSMAKNVVLGASGIVSSTSSAAIYAAR